ncbi:Hch1p [Saccharomyces eubayanus]|uniref:Hch1p n=1 Tax=Saccharomyces eubayanus TaxID=1080349 RepID=UPI0006C32021|nr:HCH1-like protein [Saccharomyces eubayanus]KOG96897.1 HCH1-like protein [Saccharomyces eubayanus]
MVVLNPNNWHWVDKNTLPWSKDYLNGKLTSLSTVCSDGKSKIELTQVSSITGDSNVSQRKGKPICYFDLQLSMSVKVTNLDTDENNEDDDGVLADGKLEIPEFMHDESDFPILSQGFDAFDGLVRSEFVPKVLETLLMYQDDLIKEHSKDVQI